MIPLLISLSRSLTSVQNLHSAGIRRVSNLVLVIAGQAGRDGALLQLVKQLFRSAGSLSSTSSKPEVEDVECKAGAV